MRRRPHGERSANAFSRWGGVPVELHGRIFYPFFTTKERGSGVGLANAQKVAVSHGGCVQLDDEPWAGARFSLVLPIGSEDTCR